MKTTIRQFVLLFVLFFSFTASAYHIEDVQYNSASKTLSVSLVFSGGEKEHYFVPTFDACVTETTPHQLAVRLEDPNWDDTGTDEIRQTVALDLWGNSCLPADLTVFVGNRHFTIFVD